MSVVGCAGKLSGFMVAVVVVEVHHLPFKMCLWSFQVSSCKCMLVFVQCMFFSFHFSIWFINIYIHIYRNIIITKFASVIHRKKEDDTSHIFLSMSVAMQRVGGLTCVHMCQHQYPSRYTTCRFKWTSSNFIFHRLFFRVWSMPWGTSIQHLFLSRLQAEGRGFFCRRADCCNPWSFVGLLKNFCICVLVAKVLSKHNTASM